MIVLLEWMVVKYSTMELNKEIVIIPKEGESISYKSSEEDHSDLLKKFLIDNNVNIDKKIIGGNIRSLIPNYTSEYDEKNTENKEEKTNELFD